MELNSNGVFEINYKLSQFFKEYGDYLLEREIRYIKEHMFDEDLYINTTILEIYEHLGLSKYLKCDLYQHFFNHLKKDCEINKSILEVGSGLIPSFARKINENQSSGKVTAMDPLIIPDIYDSIDIKTCEFTSETDVSEYDLIVGQYICELIILVIDSSFIHDIDMYVQMCECLPRQYRINNSADKFFESILSRLDILSGLTGRQYEILGYKDLNYPIIKTYKK